MEETLINALDIVNAHTYSNYTIFSILPYDTRLELGITEDILLHTYTKNKDL